MQLDIFGASHAPPDDPLLGLQVQVPDVCNKCGDAVAVIGPGKGQHKASLHCRSCDFHRGWLSLDTHKFIAEIASKFGAPTTPIVIRRGSSLAPSGRG